MPSVSRFLRVELHFNGIISMTKDRNTSEKEHQLIEAYRLSLNIQDKNKLLTTESSTGFRFFDNRLAFSVSEVAFLLGVSTRTVERMIKNNLLPHQRIGRRILVSKIELEAWLNQKE